MILAFLKPITGKGEERRGSQVHAGGKGGSGKSKGKGSRKKQSKSPTKTPSRSKPRLSLGSVSSVSSSRRKSVTASPRKSKKGAGLDSTVSTPSAATMGSAKKALKKAKAMKQLDLRKSLLKGRGSGVGIQKEGRKDGVKSGSSAERLRLAKLEKKKQMREKARLEKLKQLQLKKPVEDTQCLDSKVWRLGRGGMCTYVHVHTCSRSERQREIMYMYS